VLSSGAIKFNPVKVVRSVTLVTSATFTKPSKIASAAIFSLFSTSKVIEFNVVASVSESGEDAPPSLIVKAPIAIELGDGNALNPEVALKAV